MNYEIYHIIKMPYPANDNSGLVDMAGVPALAGIVAVKPQGVLTRLLRWLGGR